MHIFRVLERRQKKEKKYARKKNDATLIAHLSFQNA